MTGGARVNLTDAMIEQLLLDRAGSRAPDDLVASIVRIAAVTPQERAHVLPPLPVGVQRSARWLVVGIVLALLAAGLSLVGAQLFRKPLVNVDPLRGGGGLIAIDQLVGDFSCCTANPSEMHVFGFDEATGERVPLVDLPIVAGAGEGWPETWVKWSPDRTHAMLFDLGGRLLGIFDVAHRELTTFTQDTTGSNLYIGSDQIAWSPQGDRIAWVIQDSTDFKESVVVADVSGMELRRLTLPAGTDASLPSWSPDGSSIVLSGCLPCFAGTKEAPTQVDHAHLFSVPTDGSPIRELLDEAAVIFGPAAWSLDGSMLAVSTGSGIATVTVADGRDVVITHGPDTTPRWSPDGMRIAFARRDGAGQNGGIYVVNATGSALAQLATGQDYGPTWSPDGKFLLFTTNPGLELGDVTPSVWLISVVGGQPRLVFEDATADW